MKRVLAILLCAAMCLTLAACGGKTKKEDPSAKKPSISATEPGTTPEVTSAETEKPDDDDDGMTMEAFIESIQDQLEGTIESLEESGMKLEVLARGNSLVYSYQYTMDVGDTSLLKDGLEEAMDGYASTFESIYSALKLSVPDAESVIVEYLDQDGNVIVSKAYNEESSSEADDEETSPTETEEPDSDDDGMTMEAFVESIQDQLDDVIDSVEESGMKLEVLARGNSLVYSYQYLIDVGDTSLLKDGLEQGMEEAASTFENVLSMLKLAVSDAESVIVEYLDQDGNVILSKEYK